jgi:hypothetical protein
MPDKVVCTPRKVFCALGKVFCTVGKRCVDARGPVVFAVLILMAIRLECLITLKKESI